MLARSALLPLSGIALSLAFHAAAAAQTTVIFVDASATGANDGSSWTSAFVDLQDALAHAADLAGDPDPPSDIQLWIAAGTYKPGSPDAGPESTFDLVSGVALYGGFAGGEESLEERDWVENETILSGLLGTVEGQTVRAYTVVTAIDLADETVLDGLSIAHGGGFWPDYAEHGGGIRAVNSDLLIRNSIIKDNVAWIGGGVAMNGGRASFINTAISDNWGETSAGGLYATNAVIAFDESQITGNLGMWDAGGAWIDGSQLVMTNTLIEGNVIPDFGGTGLYLVETNAEIDNCLIQSNPGDDGHGQATVRAIDSTVLIRDTQIINNQFYGVRSTSTDLTLEDSVISNCGYGIWGNGTLVVRRTEITNNTWQGITWSGSGEVADSVVAFNNDEFYSGGVSWGAPGGKLAITNSVIANNGRLGGLSFGGKTLLMVNTVVRKNNGFTNIGGGVRISGDTDATIVNSTIIENYSEDVTGGIKIGGDASAAIANSIVWGNEGEDVGNPQIAGAAIVAFSIVEGDEPWPGEGNLNVDPMFLDADGRLAPESPAIDAGSNELYLAHAPDIDTDLDGNPRIVDGTGDGRAVIDIGAFEFQIPTIPGDLNGDGKVNVEDLLILLAAWGECDDCTPGIPGDCPADLTGDCKVGVADLLILLANWTG